MVAWLYKITLKLPSKRRRDIAAGTLPFHRRKRLNENEIYSVVRPSLVEAVGNNNLTPTPLQAGVGERCLAAQGPDMPPANILFFFTFRSHSRRGAPLPSLTTCSGEEQPPTLAAITIIPRHQRRWHRPVVGVKLRLELPLTARRVRSRGRRVACNSGTNNLHDVFSQMAPKHAVNRRSCRPCRLADMLQTCFRQACHAR